MYMHRWSSEEKEYLGTITPGRSYKEIQELMNKKFSCNFTFDQIKGAVKRYGFKTGRTGRFEKGFTPCFQSTLPNESDIRTSYSRMKNTTFNPRSRMGAT